MNKIIKLILASISLIYITITPVYAQETHPHWSYGGTGNPTNWGHLEEDFELCGMGRDQSPINIDLTNQLTVEGSSSLEFHYQNTPLTVINNGHTIQVNNNSESYITLNGEKYQLIQFHFHTPSEHTLEGIASAMELHFVHKNSAGKLAVVGVMIKEGKTNPTLETIWENIPSEMETNEVNTITINGNSLLPKNHNFVHYQGSLTTPPCSENVQWNIMLEPIEASPEQIETFMNLYQANSRPVQPLNGRQIEINQ